MLGELNGEARHAASTALDQDRFALLQLQGVFDGAQSREANERQGRGFDMRERRRLLRNDGRANCQLLDIGAVAAGFQDAEHLVADTQVRHALAKRRDNAGEVASQAQGKAGLAGILTGADFRVGAIDAGCRRLHDDLARAGDGIGEVADDQNLGPAEFFDVCGFHEVPLRRPGRFCRNERSPSCAQARRPPRTGGRSCRSAG